MRCKNKMAIGFLSNLRVLFLMIALCISVLPAFSQRWKQHPAMDDAPIRIIDTEHYTFFQVFQKLFSLTTTTHDVPVTAGFIYDKDNPESGIVPINENVSLHGGSIRTCEYSPEGKFLAILYLDGGVDILYDSGRIKYNNALKDIISPDWSAVNSMTISGTEIWIATSGGYIVIDGLSGTLIHKADISENIKWIARCGDNIIAFTDNGIYIASGSILPRRFSDLSVIKPEGFAGVPQMLMPRPDGSFFYTNLRTSAGHYSVNLAYQDDNTWKNRVIGDMWLSVPSVNSMLTNAFERTFTRNKDGWSFFSTGGDLYQLYNDRAQSAEDVIERIPLRMKSDPAVTRNVSFLGSWDGTSCVAYLDRGKFSLGNLIDGKMLIDDSFAIRPNAPAVAHATHLAYSPGHGTLAVNYGYSSQFTVLLNNLPALLSGYNNGVWGLPNPIYNKPRSAEENPELDALYRNNINRFPATTPTGISIDPLNPNYVWMGSTYCGIAALNLADPKADPIHLGAPSDPLSKYPGFKAVFEDCARWRGYNPTSVPSFDGDGNLWVAYHYYDGKTTGESQARLYCWPAHNRKDVLSDLNLDKIQKWESYTIPSYGDLNATIKCFAPTSPSSKNLVFMFVSAFPRLLTRFNHAGTLSDYNDDKTENILSIEDQNGGRWNVMFCYDIKEDLQTGLIWLGEETNLLCFDPTSEVKDGVIKGQVLDVTYGDTKGNPFAYINVNGLAFDDDNRLWVTTGGNGVWGISADRKRIVAHYTTENSGLPHDTAYGIVWNPDTRSLMISTAEGLVEVWPDLPPENAILANGATVYPREIKPDYSGPVMIKGIAPHARVAVCGRDGREVANIESDFEGNAIWNLTDASGKNVPLGFYIFKGSFGEVEIAVMR